MEVFRIAGKLYVIRGESVSRLWDDGLEGATSYDPALVRAIGIRVGGISQAR